MVVVFDLHNITTKYWTIGKGLAIKFWHGYLCTCICFGMKLELFCVCIYEIPMFTQ